MTTYHEFNQQEVSALIEAAKNHYDREALATSGPEAADQATPLILGETCIEVTVEDGKICLKLPIVNRDICIPIPDFIPNGTVAKACLKICTTFGIPTGACVTITALDRTIANQCFGKC